jgi:hypothetical protein
MITSITIEVMHKGYGNEHLHPEVTIDEPENRDDLTFDIHTKPHKREGLEYEFYWASSPNGIAHFVVKDPTNTSGFGGAGMRFKTEGGTYNVKGPWSSRCSVLNQWFPHSIECTLIDPRGHKFASAILISTLLEWIDTTEYAVTHHVQDDGEIRYEIEEVLV